MNTKLPLLLCCLLLAGLAPALRGGEQPAPPAVPERPWFPFPELPSVLYYEDFLDGPGPAEMGKVQDAPDLAGSKAILLGEAQISNSSKKGSVARINLAQTKLKVPGTHKLGELRLSFTYWAEDAMDGQLTFQGKEKYQHRLPACIPKKWTPVTVAFAGLKAGEKKQPVKPGELFTELEFLFIPHSGNTYQKVYVTDILVTNGVFKVVDVLPQSQKARKRLKETERTAAKDGFNYLPQNQDGIRNMLNASLRRKKDKSVLFVAPRSGESAALLKALNAAAARNKLAGYTFVPAEAPDHSPLGGLGDMRAFLKYNTDKTPALFVLLLLSYKDAVAGGTPAESVRVVLERVLAAGCVPLISLPPLLQPLSPADKPKVEGFVNAVNNICAPKGVTVIEASSMLKGVANPLEEGELSAVGLEGVAGVSAAALKHLETCLLGRN